MSRMETFPSFPPSRAARLAALLLNKHSPKEVAAAIEIMIDALDLMGGDPDIEADDAEDSFTLSPLAVELATWRPEYDVEQDRAPWIEWHSRGSHKLDCRGAERMARDPGGLLIGEDDEDDDPREEDDDSGQMDEDECSTGDGKVYRQGALVDGPGCAIGDSDHGDSNLPPVLLDRCVAANLK